LSHSATNKQIQAENIILSSLWCR